MCPRILLRIVAEFFRKIFADNQSRSHRNFVKKLALNFLSKDWFQKRRKILEKINFPRHRVWQKTTEKSCPSPDNVLDRSGGVYGYPRKYSQIFGLTIANICEYIWRRLEMQEDFRIFANVGGYLPTFTNICEYLRR